MKWKMAATTGLSLILDPMEKVSQNASLEGSLQSYVFYVDRKSKMATTAIHRLTLDLLVNVQMPFSQKLQK